jgi:hypothetical protein
MCGLCGVFLSEGSWSDASVTSPASGGRTRRHERLHRVALANRVLKLFRASVADWNGVSYVVSDATGQSEIVESIAAVWPVAERMCKRQIDPLDDRVIAAMRGSG